MLIICYQFVMLNTNQLLYCIVWYSWDFKFLFASQHMFSSSNLVVILLLLAINIQNKTGWIGRFCCFSRIRISIISSDSTKAHNWNKDQTCKPSVWRKFQRTGVLLSYTGWMYHATGYSGIAELSIWLS